MKRGMTGPSDAFLPPDLLWAGRGTAALIAFLRAAVPQGSGVLVPVNLCGIAVAGIAWSGMQPVFHDVSPDDGNAELAHLQAADTSHCKVLLAVHNFGRTVDIFGFRVFAEAHGLLLLEDACNALGASRDGRPAGRTGDAALYSFNGGKILDRGHGGAIRIHDPRLRARVAAEIDAMPAHTAEHDAAITALEEALRAARLAGSVTAQRAAFDRYRPFAEFRAAPDWPDEIAHGARDLPSNAAHRRALATIYRSAIGHSAVAHTRLADGDAPWRYCILVPPQQRGALLEFLRAESVPCSAWYPAVHDIFTPDDPAAWPGAERFGASVVNLWTDPATTPDDARRTSGLINRFFEGPDS